jgi:hypothetical protein
LLINCFRDQAAKPPRGAQRQGDGVGPTRKAGSNAKSTRPGAALTDPARASLIIHTPLSRPNHNGLGPLPSRAHNRRLRSGDPANSDLLQALEHNIQAEWEGQVLNEFRKLCEQAGAAQTQPAGKQAQANAVRC